MVFRRVIGRINSNQRGVTLIEVLVALAISGLVAAAITTAIFQVFNGSARGSNHMAAIKQMENAIYWLNRDVQMAQTVETGGDAGFPLSLTWTEWDSTVNEVTYSLEDSQIKRSHSINEESPAGMVVAQYIDTDPAMTSFSFTGGVLTYRLTATLSSCTQATTETREGEIISRPNSP